MFSEFCSLFRVDTIKTPIDLTKDLPDIILKIAQKMIDEASGVLAYNS